MNIIEPCCAERQLPQLLREQKGRAVLFQTYGDVTFDNILRSVSCMAGNDHLTLTLAVQQVTDKIQRTLRRYQERQWITTLHVLTNDLQGEVITIEGDRGTVIIQGTVIDTALQNGAPVLYAGQFCRAEAGRQDITKLLATRYNRQQKAEADAAVTVVSDSLTKDQSVALQSIADKPKKSRTRKTKKADEKPTEDMA